MKRWLYLMVLALAAGLLVSMTACEKWSGGDDGEDDSTSQDSGSNNDADDEPAQLDPGRLRDIVWVLKSWGPSGKEDKVLSGTTINLEFVDKDDISGSGGCNSYKADYEAKADGSMDIDDVAKTTPNPCLPGPGAQEDEYLDNLRDVNRYEFEDDGDLRLHYDDEFMVFE